MDNQPNHITGKIRWQSKIKPMHVDGSGFHNGAWDVSIRRLHIGSCDRKTSAYNAESGIFCALIGYIDNLEAVKKTYQVSAGHDVDALGELFSRGGPSLFGELEGVFTAFIYDEKKRQGYIVQDEYGSIFPLYYTAAGDSFYFSTSLKKLLLESKIAREFNIAAARDFLGYHYILPNEQTLVSNVYKLIPGHYLLIDEKQRNFSALSVQNTAKTEPMPHHGNLMRTIEENITACSARLNHAGLACALSSGFDSNLLLHHLAKLSSGAVMSVSIGGKEHSEVPQASACAAQHANVKHHVCGIDNNLFDALPDIVWRYEGYVTEQGIFLAYMLAKHLKAENRTSVILADCADQQLDQTRHLAGNKQNAALKRIPGMEWLARKSHAYGSYLLRKLFPGNNQCYAHSYYHDKSLELISSLPEPVSDLKLDFTIDFVLKKSGIMQNSFGIQPLYPFLGRKIKMLSRALGRKNARKAYYKKQVLELLGRKKARHISKKPGSTDIWHLFAGREDLIAKIFESDIITRVVPREILDTALKNPRDYCSFILQGLIFFVFNELFIKTVPDADFNAAEANIPLGTLLKDTRPR